MPTRRPRSSRHHRPAAVRWSLAVLAAAAAPVADAQQVSEDGRTYYLQSSVTFRETLTDNGRLASGDGRVESITEVVPRVRLGARTRWVRGSIDYSLRGVAYARDSDRNEVTQSLSLGTGASGAGEFELIENRLFLDARADISQRAVSPFGLSTDDTERTSDNLRQVGSFALAPYLVGNVGSLARYRLGLSHTARTAPDSFSLDANSTSAQLSIGSGPAFARVGWGLVATRTRTDYDVSRRTTDTASVVGTLTYAVDFNLLVSANAGADWNNYASVSERRYDRYGVGLQWRPTERTNVSAQVEDRFFGTGYNVVLQHRTPRTVWTLSSTRDASDFLGRGTAVLGTAYELLYAQFASIQPDPLLREQLVLEFLANNGIPPETLLLSDFLFSSATLRQEHRLSFALLGRRSTLTVAATQSRTSRIDTVVSAVDIFDESRFVRQRGLSVTGSHRLTQRSALSLRLAEQRNRGQLATQDTRLRTAVLRWSVDLGERTDFSLAARHTRFSSPTRPYDENALIAALTLRFY